MVLATPASNAQIKFWKDRMAAELAEWHASPRGNRKRPEPSHFRNEEMSGFIMMLIARVECEDYHETEEYAEKMRVAYGLEE